MFMTDNKLINESNMTRKRKTNKLQLRITDDELEALNLISFEDDESISQVVRKAIKAYNKLRKTKTNDYI